MRKVDYEYELIEANDQKWWIKQTKLLEEESTFCVCSPYYESRFLCYEWIEKQEKENEQ